MTPVLFISGYSDTGKTTLVKNLIQSFKGMGYRVAAVKHAAHGYEPAGSPVLSGGQVGVHNLQGIGAGFIPSVLDQNLIDQVFTVGDEQAIETAKAMMKKEGIMAGISSGAAVYAALQVAAQLSPQKAVLAIAPDTGERYLSTALFD
jgi:cysteine synthase A